MHAHIRTSLCSHTRVPHTFAPVDMWTCTHTYAHHILTCGKRECTRRKCLAFETMRHNFWTTVCAFKSIFVSRPLHPGDAMRKISSKIIRSIDIPVTCGHCTIRASRSCLPQQVSGAPASSAPKPVHFRPHICSSFLWEAPSGKILPALAVPGVGGKLPPTSQPGTHRGKKINRGKKRLFQASERKLRGGVKGLHDRRAGNDCLEPGLVWNQGQSFTQGLLCKCTVTATTNSTPNYLLLNSILEISILMGVGLWQVHSSALATGNTFP